MVSQVTSMFYHVNVHVHRLGEYEFTLSYAFRESFIKLLMA